MRTSLSLLLLATLFAGHAQMQDFRYKRKISNPTNLWHTLEVSDSMFSKIAYDASDLRIYGITSTHDTVEAPFLYRVAHHPSSDQEVTTRILNTSKNDEGYFYTLALPSKSPINELNLSFRQKNFDWRIKVAGSHDQKTWFTLLEDYRILSIDNNLTQFSFTRVAFPEASFSYFRIQIPSKEKPELLVARLVNKKNSETLWKTYPIANWKAYNDPKNKQTIIQVDLGLPVPASLIRLSTNEDFDFYRPLEVSYLADSLKSENGWKYEYRSLTNGTLNSLETNAFRFTSTVLQKLTIRISNYDNQPLSFSGVEVSGYQHLLVARFTTPATYYLTYGNSAKRAPNYDLIESTLPTELTPLTLGSEEVLAVTTKEDMSPLFENKLWLWGIMAIIIAVLGYATLKMISKKEG